MKTDATRETYDTALRDYMKKLRLFTVEELICGGVVKQIESNIIKFMVAERKAGTSSSLISIRLGALKKFYDMNDILLNWKKIYCFMGPPTPKRKDRAYTKEEIRKLLSVCDLREKVVVLLLSSTGMRIGGLVGVKLGDLQRIDKYWIYRITVYANTEDEHYTFCTPEAAQALDDWLSLRRAAKEKLTDESYVLREKFDKDDYPRVVRPERATENMIQLVLREKLVESGVRIKTRKVRRGAQGKIRHDVKVTHGFRKYFDTVMTKAGVPPLYVEMLVGRTIGVKQSYFKPSERDLLEGNDRMLGYLSAVNELCISEEPQLKVKVRQLQQEKDQLIERLESRMQYVEACLVSQGMQDKLDGKILLTEKEKREGIIDGIAIEKQIRKEIEEGSAAFYGN